MLLIKKISNCLICKKKLTDKKILYKQVIERIEKYGFVLLLEQEGYCEYVYHTNNDGVILLGLSLNAVSIHHEHADVDFKQVIADRYWIENMEQLDFLLLNSLHIGDIIKKI